MTTNIIAIDEHDLICPECGNSDPEKFTTIVTPYLRDGLVQGLTASGVTCSVCETSIGFDRVANSTFG
jgi:hypothetical protein